MRNTSWLVRPFLILSAASGILWLTLAAQNPVGAGRPAPPKYNGQLTLKNVNSDTLRVELRFGDATDCATYRQSVTRLLAPGKRWLVAVPTGVCWRHQRVARGVGAAWAPWRREVVSAGQREEIALQEGT